MQALRIGRFPFAWRTVTVLVIIVVLCNGTGRRAPAVRFTSVPEEAMPQFVKNDVSLVGEVPLGLEP